MGRASVIQFVLAEFVIEETERALRRGTSGKYGGHGRFTEDFHLLLARIKIEQPVEVSEPEFKQAERFIRHMNDVPVLAAAIKAKPDWLLTNNTRHFDSAVAKKTGLHIVNCSQFLDQAGRIFPR